MCLVTVGVCEGVLVFVGVGVGVLVLSLCGCLSSGYVCRCLVFVCSTRSRRCLCRCFVLVDDCVIDFVTVVGVCCVGV